jgi:ribosomal protein S21
VTSVVAYPGEPFEALLLRFRRGVEASGILREYRCRRRFIPNHEQRRLKVRKALRRQRRPA